MNTVHLKYAIVVAKTGSISKAAESLFMNQPNLSKAIRELEDTVGIKIFNRTSKGIVPTKKGEEFLLYAANIIKQLDEIESLYKPNDKKKTKFDIAVPRASYISYSFMKFLIGVNTTEKLRIDYRETNSLRAIKNVANNENNLGIARFQLMFEKYFMQTVEEKKLKFEPLWEFEYKIIFSEKSKLATCEVIDKNELDRLVEITHGDITIPSLTLARMREIQQADERPRTISIYERASQFEILSTIPETYMFVSSVPQEILNKYGLIQRDCNIENNKYKDILVYRSDYHLSPNDKKFLKILNQTINEINK